MHPTVSHKSLQSSNSYATEDRGIYPT